MPERTICWEPVWNRKQQGGLEHLLLAEQTADGMVLAFDDGRRPFRLAYRLSWDDDWSVREADLVLTTDRGTRSLNLQTDGRGRWRYRDGKVIHALDGSLDIDIWPTPFTNTFPIRRVPMDVRERREFRVAWVLAPDLTFQPQAQAYTRLAERLYLFENLDGSGFRAKIAVDDEGVVVDYPGLFRRVPATEPDSAELHAVSRFDRCHVDDQP